MSGLWPSIIALGTLIAIAAWLGRRAVGGALGATRRALTFATAMQAAHFGEETWFDFHIAFPALFGLPPMPFGIFIGFNLICLAVWALAVVCLPLRAWWAMAAAWFLALAGVGNGIAHPLFAVVSNGYFPGLVTAVPLAVCCIWLWRALQQAHNASAARA